MARTLAGDNPAGKAISRVRPSAWARSAIWSFNRLTRRRHIGFVSEASRTAEILPTHTPALFEAAVRRATQLLRAGEVVVLPTETVYGLAANALNPNAVLKIFEIKQRPERNPVIVHVASLEMARACASAWPSSAERLAGAFWPGPLTLVLPRAREIPDSVTAGGDTVGIRWPGHPFIQAVIRSCGFPLAAPSANVSNQVSPTRAGHVQRTLGGRVPLIIDGGQAQVGIESTVVDVTANPARILRPGMIHEDSLRAALGEGRLEMTTPTASSRQDGGAFRSPGQLDKHYSPQARLVVLEWTDDAMLRSQLRGLNLAPQDCHVVAHTHIPQGPDWFGASVIPHDAEAFARALYAEWHRCDEAGAPVIVMEAPPEGPEWRGVRDRIRRAGARADSSGE
jgi:L-threonylcarbamoyladenylate synthase